jgi:hypothetical protein
MFQRNMLPSIFNPEDEGRMSVLNISFHSQDNMMSQSEDSSLNSHHENLTTCIFILRFGGSHSGGTEEFYLLDYKVI